MNLIAGHFAVMAGYGRAQGYFELRWRSEREMHSEFVAIAARDSAAARARVLSVDHDVYVGAAPRSRKAGTRAAVREAWTLWVDCDDPDSHERLNEHACRKR
jgi:hypothetical protein